MTVRGEVREPWPGRPMLKLTVEWRPEARRGVMRVRAVLLDGGSKGPQPGAFLVCLRTAARAWLEEPEEGERCSLVGHSAGRSFYSEQNGKALVGLSRECHDLTPVLVGSLQLLLGEKSGAG